MTALTHLPVHVAEIVCEELLLGSFESCCHSVTYRRISFLRVRRARHWGATIVPRTANLILNSNNISRSKLSLLWSPPRTHTPTTITSIKFTVPIPSPKAAKLVTSSVHRPATFIRPVHNDSYKLLILSIKVKRPFQIKAITALVWASQGGHSRSTRS